MIPFEDRLAQFLRIVRSDWRISKIEIIREVGVLEG